MKDKEKNTSYVIGRNAVLELLRSGRSADKLYVKRGEHTGSINVILAEAKKRHIPISETELAKLDFMADGMAHQGVIASAPEKEYCSVDDILALAEERGEKPLIAMADGIEDPRNLGAIIRAAEGAGAHGLIIPKHRAVGLTGVVGKASAGALEHLLVARVGNLSDTIEDLKKKGLWIYAAEAGGQLYYECDMNSPAVLVFGSEGKGVSRLVREKSDFTVSIPMYGKVNSLNVSTAAAVLLYEAARQHRA